VNVFLDSSALAKRYVQEPGSDQVEGILQDASALGLAIICVPEVVSALSRLRRERKLTAAQFQEARRALFEEIADCSVIQITDAVVRRAVDLLVKHPLRAADAMHIAAAAEWRADLFVSADARPCAAARSSGLKVLQLT